MPRQFQQMALCCPNFQEGFATMCMNVYVCITQVCKLSYIKRICFVFSGNCFDAYRFRPARRMALQRSKDQVRKKDSRLQISTYFCSFLRIHELYGRGVFWFSFVITLNQGFRQILQAFECQNRENLISFVKLHGD